jgi:quinol monooxygenase YgiN
MVICFLKIVPHPDKRDAVFEILRSVIELTRGRPGCMGCATYEEHNHQRSIFYMEQWESKEELNRHIQSSLYNWILGAMELASEVPEIYFHEVSKTTGMDLIQVLRTQEGANKVVHSL